MHKKIFITISIKSSICFLVLLFLNSCNISWTADVKEDLYKQVSTEVYFYAGVKKTEEGSFVSLPLSLENNALELQTQLDEGPSFVKRYELGTVLKAQDFPLIKEMENQNLFPGYKVKKWNFIPLLSPGVEIEENESGDLVSYKVNYNKAVFYAEWELSDHIPYKVEYFFQTTDGPDNHPSVYDETKPSKSVIKYGTPGTIVSETIEEDTFPGFKYGYGGEGSIAFDGSTVVQVFCERKLYKVYAPDINDLSNIREFDYYYEQKIQIQPPQLQNKKFSHWIVKDVNENVYPSAFEYMPAFDLYYEAVILDPAEIIPNTGDKFLCSFQRSIKPLSVDYTLKINLNENGTSQDITSKVIGSSLIKVYAASTEITNQNSVHVSKLPGEIVIKFDQMDSDLDYNVIIEFTYEGQTYSKSVTLNAYSL